MFNKKIEDDSEHSFWISYADMLTGFLISFMVIALLLASQVKKCPECPPPCPNEGKGSAANTQRALIKELWKEFHKDDIIQVDTITKTVRFRQLAGNELFKRGDVEVSKLLAQKLDYFIPKYFDLIYEIKKQNKVDIKEIRIEGHTDDTPSAIDHTDVYRYNYKCSIERSFNVLKYFVENSQYIKGMHQKAHINWLFFMDRLVPSGYAYTKPLDSKGELTTLDSLNPEQSRRIEFRVIIEDKPKK
jgi:flagellar motor protein MotB